jgi:copper chaperone CopZ
MSTQQKETFDIDGMSCAHCVAAVEEALSSMEGATVEEVEIGSATVAYDPESIRRSALVDAIEEAGYTVTS